MSNLDSKVGEKQHWPGPTRFLNFSECFDVLFISQNKTMLFVNMCSFIYLKGRAMETGTHT